jgi:hypothetical protein
LLLVVFPWGVAWLLGGLALGRFWPHLAAVPALGACVTLPLLAALLQRPPATIWGCAGLATLTIAKRLEGNREPLPPGETWLAVLGRRLLLDRDIADFQRWSRRGLANGGIPGDEPAAALRDQIRTDVPPEQA